MIIGVLHLRESAVAYKYSARTYPARNPLPPHRGEQGAYGKRKGCKILKRYKKKFIRANEKKIAHRVMSSRTYNWYFSITKSIFSFSFFLTAAGISGDLIRFT
jgi:hypothetical protein